MKIVLFHLSNITNRQDLDMRKKMYAGMPSDKLNEGSPKQMARANLTHTWAPV